MARLPNPKRVYLDKAFLNKAHEAFLGSGGATLNAVNEISEKGHLCISFAHVFEFLDGTDKQAAKRRLNWIDKLSNKLYCYSESAVIQRAELKQLIFRKLTAKSSSIKFCTGSYVDWITKNAPLSPEKTPDLLRYQSLERIAEQAFDTDIMGNILDINSRTIHQMSENNRKSKETHQVRKKRALKNTCAHIKRLICEEANKVAEYTTEEVVELASAIGAGMDPVNDIQQHIRQIKVTEADLPKMPFIFVSTSAARELSLKVPSNLTPKNYRNKYRAEIFDLAHLVGAAYCDIFTCDSRTHSNIGKSREKLGFDPPLAVGQKLIRDFDCLASVIISKL